MILHCFICSCGGKRVGPHSEVAIIREDEIKLPLQVDHFEGLKFGGAQAVNPFKDIASAAPRIDAWLHMRCRHGHTPWPRESVWERGQLAQNKKAGGPSKILTDQGWMQLNEKGIKGEGDKNG